MATLKQIQQLLDRKRKKKIDNLTLEKSIAITKENTRDRKIAREIFDNVASFIESEYKVEKFDRSGSYKYSAVEGYLDNLSFRLMGMTKGEDFEKKQKSHLIQLEINKVKEEFDELFDKIIILGVKSDEVKEILMNL